MRPLLTRYRERREDWRWSHVKFRESDTGVPNQTSSFQSMRVAYSDHSSNPVCCFSMMEQVRHCTVWPLENWLGTSKTTYLTRVRWMIWICYSRALERRCLSPICETILQNKPSFPSQMVTQETRTSDWYSWESNNRIWPLDVPCFYSWHVKSGLFLGGQLPFRELPYMTRLVNFLFLLY